MEMALMGKVLVTARIENLDDLFQVARGAIRDDEVRRVEVGDAVVDTGATVLSMPRRFIQQLGLMWQKSGRARTSAGTVDVQVYGAVKLTIQGRDCFSEVVEMPDDGPVLIGRILLQMLDFVVNPSGQSLIGNPEHGGEHILELY